MLTVTQTNIIYVSSYGQTFIVWILLYKESLSGVHLCAFSSSQVHKQITLCHLFKGLIYMLDIFCVFLKKKLLLSLFPIIQTFFSAFLSY